MTSTGSFLVRGAIFLALAQTCLGQRAWNWRVFSAADGLPESAVVSAASGAQGKVLARSLIQPSVSELDGYNVSIFPAPGLGKSRVYESPGGQLWTVSTEGLEEFREGRWLAHPVPEIAAEVHARGGEILDPIPLCPVRQGHVIFLLPDRLVEFNAEALDRPAATTLLSAARTHLEKFSGMAMAHDGGLWATGAGGLVKIPGPLRNLRPECEFKDCPLPEALSLRNLRDPHMDGGDGVTALADYGTNNATKLARFDGNSWTIEADLPAKVRHAWRNDDSCWAATSDTLFQQEPGRRDLVENDEIAARHYYDVSVESGGVFWLASSDGLLRYSPLIWRSPSFIPKAGSPIQCLAGDQQRIWFVAGNFLYSLPQDNPSQHTLSSVRLRADQSPHTLYPLKDGSVLLETDEGMFRCRPADTQVLPLRWGERQGSLKALGLLGDGSVCFQVLGLGSLERGYRLESYDGSALKPFLDAPSDPLFGTNLNCVFAAQNGDVWLGSENGTAVFHEKKWRTFVATDKTVPGTPVEFTELADGRIWCATQDRIWEFDGRNWSSIRGGFDRINALLRSRDGSVWLASNGGLLRFFQGAWVENGPEEGLPSTVVRLLHEDARGHLWAGTTHGLSLYHPDADPDPPQTSIRELTGDESRVPQGRTIFLSFSGLDKWKQTSRLRLLYSYRLDERDWSPFLPENSISFADLPAGKHYFQARAMDRNCNIDPKPARIEFAIVLPWYKELRLVGIALAGLAGALFFAAVAFNRHRQLVRSYAEVEKKVTERTQELELANRALVHSQKMNALGTLAAGIAHDFNNILSIIKGSAQIIGDNLEDQRKITTRVERINTAVEQGTGIVKAMLGFSRDSGKQSALCDVNAIVQETLKLLGDRFLREVHVSFERAADLPQVHCSPDFVQQILLNLIFNAAESMEKPKRIVLATRLSEQMPPHAVLEPDRAARYVAISVRDFGCGIPAENLARIFEPFFTTKAFSARRGTGLGLSMVYELAKKLTAGLMVESVVEQGSTFTLILPVKDSPPENKPSA